MHLNSVDIKAYGNVIGKGIAISISVLVVSYAESIPAVKVKLNRSIKDLFFRIRVPVVKLTLRSVSAILKEEPMCRLTVYTGEGNICDVSFSYILHIIVHKKRELNKKIVLIEMLIVTENGAKGNLFLNHVRSVMARGHCVHCSLGFC